MVVGAGSAGHAWTSIHVVIDNIVVIVYFKRMNWTTKDLPDQTGRTFVITGANSGIGLGAAQALAAHGARVVLAVRDTDKGEAAAKKIDGETEVGRWTWPIWPPCAHLRKTSTPTSTCSSTTPAS